MHGRTIRVHMAHMPGVCAAAQTPDGQTLFTSGVDATLRAHDIQDRSPTWWKAQPPKEPTLSDLSVADLHEKPVTALAISPNGQTLASASLDGFVRIFSLVSDNPTRPDAHFVQACARFGGPVRALAFSPSGAFLAAAGDEPGVLKIIMTAQPSNVNVLRAPPGPAQDAIVALAFDPTGDFVISISEKGSPVVWDVDRCVMHRTVDLNDRKAQGLTWAPDGSHIAFATNRGAVVVSRISWVFDFLLEDATDKDEDDDDTFAPRAGKDHITAVSWSPNGRYLLAARKDCNISMWDIHNRKVLAVWKADQVAQKVMWHVKSNAFIIVDQIAHWGIVADVVPSHMPTPQSASTPVIALPTVPDVDENPTSKKRSREKNDDEEDEGAVKRSKGAKARRQKQLEKKEKAKLAKEAKKKWAIPDVVVEDNDQELENGFTINLSDVDADDEEELGNKRGSGSDSSHGSDEDSDEEVPGELAGLENGGVHLPDLPKARGSAKRSKSHSRVVQTVTVQSPFVPTSTPMSEKMTKKRRILAWNLVGTVLSFAEPTHDVVEIEFAEANKRSIGIKDHFGYSMGCLSETGAFLASNKSKNHGALVTFRPFSSWASNAEWTIYLPPDDDVSVIALGQRFAVAATLPNNVIRVFSLSGLQTSVFAITGNVVTMAANGDNLVIVYCEPGSNSLKCELMEINAEGEPEKIVYDGWLKTCNASQLEWVGFTNDTRELCAYDSKGWLWLLTDARASRRWMPVVQNAAKCAECDWFWVASATSEQLIGAACLSNERFPPAKPRPALRPVALTAPVIDRVTKAGKPTVAERLGRTKLKLLRAMAAKAVAEEMYDTDDDEIGDAEDAVTLVETETDKCLLKLMEDACRREQNMRALDLATRLHCEVSFKYAMELARHFKREALAVRVEQVARHKLAVIAEEHGGRRKKKETVEQEREEKGVRSSPVTPTMGEKRGGWQREMGSKQDKDGDGGGSLGGMELCQDEAEVVEMEEATTDKTSTATKVTRSKGKVEKVVAKKNVMDEVSDDDEEELRERGGEDMGKEEEVKPEDKRGSLKEAVMQKMKAKRLSGMTESQASMKVGARSGDANLKGSGKVVGTTVKKKAATPFRNKFVRK